MKVFSICHRCQRCKYLHEFLKKFEKALMVYSGAWGKLIHEKYQKSKIWRHCPLKLGCGMLHGRSGFDSRPACYRIIHRCIRVVASCMAPELSQFWKMNPALKNTRINSTKKKKKMYHELTINFKYERNLLKSTVSNIFNVSSPCFELFFIQFNI